MTVVKTYEQAVKAIVDEIYERTDFDTLRELIEDGCVGISECTNAELISEWAELFGGPALEISDPESNPNKEAA